MDKHYTYLLLDLASVFFPFVLSFDKKVAFYKHWKYLFPSIFITGLFFIIWDIIFTKQGVWSFNEEYITGLYVFNLPIEEVLFFLCVPYACVFIYEVLNAYISSEIIKNHKPITYVFLAITLFLSVFYYDRTYTVVNAGACFLLLLIAEFGVKFDKFGRFYLAFFVSLIPFLLCNGILTSWPIVLYNNQENMNIRIGTIPFEDIFYCLSLLLSCVLLMQFFKKKFSS